LAAYEIYSKRSQAHMAEPKYGSPTYHSNQCRRLGDRADNRPENLRLYANHSAHMRVEHPGHVTEMNAARKRG
jgi:hypothetical protein